MRFHESMLRLYAVTDRAWLGSQTLAQQVEAAIRGGATCVQLREKDTGRETFLALARELRQVCTHYTVPLIINDDVDIALQVQADGVHVGQEDLSARQIRRMAGRDLIVGVTAKTVEQALLAQAQGADYLGSGAVFGSATKPNAKPMSMERLQAICRAVEIPVVAIGGIGPENVALLRGSGVRGAAVVSGIFAAADVEERCRQLRSVLETVIV